MNENLLIEQIKNMTEQIVILSRTNQNLSKTIQEQNQQIQLLQEENQGLKRRIFGSKSETTKSLGFEQLSLFNEVEEIVEKEKFETETIKYTRKKKQKGFLKEKLDQLPHEKVVMKVPEDQRTCPICETEMKRVGEEFVRYEVVFVPSKLYVKEIWRETLECRNCRKKGKSVMIKAGVSEPVIPHSYTSPESVAYIMKMKYQQGVPLYRQEQDWKQMGLELSRTTMANWVIQASRTWLKPLIEHMHDELLKEHYIHGDETRVQVLKEPGKKATSQSYMWVYANINGSQHPIRLFDYRPNRSGDNPKEYLKGFSGYLITDAYAGYNHLEGVTNVYCWAHARRKFVEALPKDRKGIEDSLSCRAIEKIGKLFAIEKKIADLDCEEKKRIRQNEAVPLLKDFFTWCHENRDKTLKESKVNKAFSYALDHQKELCRYIEDGHLPMTNSLDERVIRPFTTGRKNWLFSDSVKGAESSGYVYSIIETAKANQIDPYKYLCFVFKNMPGSDYIRNREVIENLMPWSRQAQEICK